LERAREGGRRGRVARRVDAHADAQVVLAAALQVLQPIMPSMPETAWA
jgi:valyl-tRNA synthetase